MITSRRCRTVWTALAATDGVAALVISDTPSASASPTITDGKDF